MSRSLKKGPFYEEHLLKKVEKMKAEIEIERRRERQRRIEKGRERERKSGAREGNQR